MDGRIWYMEYFSLSLALYIQISQSFFDVGLLEFLSTRGDTRQQLPDGS